MKFETDNIISGKLLLSKEMTSTMIMKYKEVDLLRIVDILNHISYLITPIE